MYIERNIIYDYIESVRKKLFEDIFGKQDIDIISNTIDLLEKTELDNYQSFLLRLNEELPVIKESLEEDIKAAIDADPAANSKEEIVLTYPGFYAILTYRLAHLFYLEKIPILPRYLSEVSHSLTGIDINPGAIIGRRFFIDHGTGIVIGETTIIGDDVKIYQGVTLGAFSLRKGKNLKGIKRHPTIRNNVTIYSNSSIFGGETIIDDGITISANSIITSSVMKD